MFELAINNGYLIDPKNKVFSKLNIGIKDGKVRALSKELLMGETEIDASNKIVSPGFIDIHIHEDKYDEKEDKFEFCIAESMLKMGVTTAIGGNCGSGPIDPGKYLDAADRLGYPVNIGLLSGHDSLRNSVCDLNKYMPVEYSHIEKMCLLLERHLEEGCMGVSLGIRYIPGMDKREMLSLAKISARHKKVLAAHLRDDSHNVIPSLMELIELGQESGVPLQVSHIGSMAGYGQMEDMLKTLDHFRSLEMNIESDCYPYTAFCTEIGATTYDEGFLERYGIDYSAIEIAEGKYRGRRCTEEIFTELRRDYPNTLTIGHVMKEQDIESALNHPAVIMASDGIYHNGQGHPRGSGSFPRLISEYVKNKKLISLNSAIEKMTYLPAKRFGLLQKGHLSIGADADITIFDFEKIKDRATFQSPLEAPEGIEYVIISGKVALKYGNLQNRKHGRALRA